MSTVPAPRAPLTPRAGLGRTGERLASAPLTIAYLGASITVQRDGYRPRLQQRLQRRFEQEHRGLLAGVGGVGAISAVFLMDRFALAQEPDLCFVDYSSADLGSVSPIGEVEHAADGILGKLAGAGCPACVLHMTRAEWTPRCEEVIAAWERAADRHGIPSIDPGAALRRMIDSGEWSSEHAFHDSLHTRAAASDLLAGMIDEAFAELAAGDAGEPLGEDPGPLTGPDYRLARVLPASIDDAVGEAREMRLYRLSLPYLQIGVGESISIEPPGVLVGVMLLRGPDSGEIAVDSDLGEEHASVWDEWCFYERIGTVVFERRPSAGPVTIRLTGAPPERRPVRHPFDPTRWSAETSETTLKVFGYMVLTERPG